MVFTGFSLSERTASLSSISADHHHRRQCVSSGIRRAYEPSRELPRSESSPGGHSSFPCKDLSPPHGLSQVHNDQIESRHQIKHQNKSKGIEQYRNRSKSQHDITHFTSENYELFPTISNDTENSLHPLLSRVSGRTAGQSPRNDPE
jgi:hypothetical protein